LHHRPISYVLWIGLDKNSRPVVEREQFKQRRANLAAGQPFNFVNLKRGKGDVYAGEFEAALTGKAKLPIKLDDPRKLAIASLGNLSEHPNIVRFREFLEGWYLSYFIPNKARNLPMAGAQRKLNTQGDNLANYVQYLHNEHQARFKSVLKDVSKRVPGIQKIDVKKSEDGRLLLQFNDRGYTDPFYAPSMSDGTLKYFAYLLMLEDPDPSPLIGIEEPENGLHHKLLAPLAGEMRRRASEKGGPQVFVTTHANHFVDALRPEEVFVLAKNLKGHSTVMCAAERPEVVGMVQDGLPLGSLWYSNHFGGNP
ncbi:MAG: hypothetical protein RL689_1356, partial [Planctomycetota bacterium]